jgi:hypothetical protein
MTTPCTSDDAGRGAHLGWLLARSVMDTRGMGWAWFIHFLQDVVIISVLLYMGM